LLTVGPLIASDDLLDAWCEQWCAGLAADAGTVLSPQDVAALIRAEEAPPVKRWAARLDTELVGVAQSAPNGELTKVRLYVAEPHRRRGVGRALLRVLAADAEGQRLRAVANAGEAGERFAAAVGARVVMRLLVMSQPLAEIDLDGPGPEGYELLVWRGEAPERLLASYAAAKCHIADAPGAHEQGAAAWDPARVRAWEESLRASGQTPWVCAAIFDGAVAAFTELAVGASPTGDQHDTAVLPVHRGVGLAVAVKRHLARQVRAARPDITRVIVTVNAEHRAMIAVNEKLGYRIARERLLLEATPANGVPRAEPRSP
jgi:mycothiol synthase